jgi:hypothetical protein
MPQLPASNINSSQRLNCSSALTHSLTNNLLRSLTDSPVQSSKLPLVFASTVVLDFWPRQHPWPYFCSLQIFRVLNGVPFSKRGGVCLLLVTPPLLGSDSVGTHSHSFTHSSFTQLWLVLFITSRHGPHRKPRYSVPVNGPLPSSGRCLVVCFAVFA